MPEISYFIRMASSLLELRFIVLQIKVVEAKKYQQRGKSD